MSCSAAGRIGGAMNTTNRNNRSRELRRLRASAAGLLCMLLLPVSANAGPGNAAAPALSLSGHVQSDDIARHQARIAELEQQTTRDTYPPALGEAYLGLANAFSATGNHEAALDTYSSALQVVRVTEGLKSLNQLPILQAQLTALEQTRQWQRYDETLGLIYTISQDQLPVGDDQRVEALNQLSKWKLRATDEELLNNLLRDSGDLVELYETELSRIEQTGTTHVSDFAIASLELGEAYARLALARNVIKKPISEYRSITSEATMARTPCQSTDRGPRGGRSQACMAAARPNLDYYRVPQDKKDQEVRRHLETLRLTILDAAKTLEERNGFPERSLLVEDFRFLAETFTEIVSR